MLSEILLSTLILPLSAGPSPAEHSSAALETQRGPRARRGDRARGDHAPPRAGVVEPIEGARIAWFGTLEGGLAEAERTGRPILLLSAAPHCRLVPGVW